MAPLKNTPTSKPSGGKQSTLFGYFSKAPPTSSPVPTHIDLSSSQQTSSSRQTIKQSQDFKKTTDYSSAAAKSSPLAPVRGKVNVESKSTLLVASDSDTSMNGDAHPIKSTRSKKRVVDSDDEIPVPVRSKENIKAPQSRIVSKRSKPNNIKKSSKNDDASFFVDSDESEQSDHSSSAFVPSDEDDAPVTKSGRRKQPKSTAASARPSLKTALPSQSHSSFKTSAELASEAAKADKRSEDSPFTFLVNPKDKQGNPVGHPDYDPRSLFISPKEMANLKPFEKQFWEIKSNHFDCVLFFQKGKFFELYEDDARIGHKQFDLKLTDRVRMAMVGVPESTFDFWTAKFLAAGYKVGKVEQCETALGAQMAAAARGASTNNKAETLVRRELKTVLTNGTLVDAGLLCDENSTHCISIKEMMSEDVIEYGVTILEASTGEFTLAHLKDDRSRTRLETLIRQMRPKEIVHEQGNLDPTTLRLIKQIVPMSCLWTGLRAGLECPSYSGSLDLMNGIFGDENAVGETRLENFPEVVVQMLTNKLTIESLGSLYVYLNQLNLGKELLTMRNFCLYDPDSKGKAMILDGRTLAHIEVLVNNEGSDEGSLCKLLSRCVTPFGQRLFRTWLCSPLCEPQAINKRLDCVEYLMQADRLSEIFHKSAKKIPDLERLISRIHAGSLRTSQFVMVLKGFSLIASAFENMLSSLDTSDFKSGRISQLIQSSPDLQSMVDNISRMFTIDQEDVVVPTAKMDPACDNNRETIDQILQELQDCLPAYRKKFKLTESQLFYMDKGTVEIFSIEVPLQTKVPSDWTSLSRTTKVARYYSPEVKQLVQNLKEARETRTSLLKDFGSKLYMQFDLEYKSWIKAVKIYAELDCLLSLAKASVEIGEPSCRPVIIQGDSACLAFDKLRHPSMAMRTDFIPNDVTLGGSSPSCILLTGPNMAGKSTLLRMTATACIMAQLGMYVPAQSARICPVDRISSRLGAYDNMFSAASTFMVELSETSKILAEATSRSLVILDELGRGTSTTQAIAIAGSVLHRLATHDSPCCIFSTHYASLADDFAYHTNISPKHMDVQVDKEKREILFKYRLVDGCSLDSYGHHVAKLAGVPDSVTMRAEVIGHQYEQTFKSNMKENQKNRSTRIALPIQADFKYLFDQKSASNLSYKDVCKIASSFESHFRTSISIS